MKAFVFTPLDGQASIELRGVMFPRGVPVTVRDQGLVDKLAAMPSFRSAPVKAEADVADPVDEVAGVKDRQPAVVESIRSARTKRGG